MGNSHPNQTAIRVTEFSNLKVNTGVPDSIFNLPPKEGWDIRSEALEQ